MNTATEVRNPAAVQALRGVSHALRPVHGALLDATRRQYEASHGKVKSPAALLQLALNDENFSWLRPLSELMARFDALTDQAEVDPLEVMALHAAVESWTLLSTEPQDGFQARYVGLLQERPDLVIAHSELRTAVQKLEQVAAPLARSLFEVGGRGGRMAYA